MLARILASWLRALILHRRRHTPTFPTPSELDLIASPRPSLIVQLLDLPVHLLKVLDSSVFQALILEGDLPVGFGQLRVRIVQRLR